MKKIVVSSFVFLIVSLLTVGTSLAQGPKPTATPPKVGRAVTSVRAAALGTTFTYQGQLKLNGTPVNNTCDFRFGLWDSLSGGAQVGASPQTKASIQVANGSFSVPLDFGAAFAGDARWLETEVRCPSGSGNYTLMTPREPINVVPYAMYAQAAPLALPSAGSINTSSDAFAITNTGSGRAAVFQINNTSSATEAVGIYSNGVTTTLHVVHDGTGGNAGRFENTNVAHSTGATLYASNVGLGAALRGEHYGTGSAGYFMNYNSANNNATLRSETNGTGNAITALHTGTNGIAGLFTITNTLNSSSALQATTYGNGKALSVFTYGLGGAGMFDVSNTSNTMPALQSRTNGSGDAISGWQTGSGKAGYFFITNTLNSSDVLFATTNGTGRAGNFQITNPTSSMHAILVLTEGLGDAGAFSTNNAANTGNIISSYTNGLGRVGWFDVNNPANNSNALEVQTNGTGRAGYFKITNTANASAAFEVTTNGTGRAGDFRITNTSNSMPVIGAVTFGLGQAGNFGIANVTNNKTAVAGYTNGTGVAGDFYILNTASSAPALSASTNGTGNAGYFVVNNPSNDVGALNVQTNGTGWAGNFTATGNGNGVYISAPNQGLNVASGTKNAVVATANGARLMYTEESSQVWFTDYGFGRLQNGRVTVTLDSLFAQTVNLDEPYHVFVQSYGDAELYVTNRTRTGFEVRARDGDPSAEFSYRLVAKRLGFEQKRLERAPWADNDPNLYPTNGAPR